LWFTPADGAIFHAGINERPIFEDRRARNVGDILTINVVESTAGARSTSGGSQVRTVWLAQRRT